MTEYRTASIIQLFSFVSLIGPFIPYRMFILPVTLIYSAGFWCVYILAAECDMRVHEAVFTFLSYGLLTALAAYITELSSLRAYLQNKEMLSIIEAQ